MPLEAPVLDRRTFDEIYREALLRIPRYTPEWTDFNETLIPITSDHPSTGVVFADWSSVTIKIGSTTLDVNETKAMRGLVLPVYVFFGGDIFSGFNAMQGYWWNSFPFPNAVSGAGEDWNLDLNKMPVGSGSPSEFSNVALA